MMVGQESGQDLVQVAHRNGVAPAAVMAAAVVAMAEAEAERLRDKHWVRSVSCAVMDWSANWMSLPFSPVLPEYRR